MTRRGLARGAILAVGIVLGGEVVYLVGANAFLTTRWPRTFLNRRPEKVQVEWEGAWTVLPGVVHLREIRFRAQSQRVQWYATLEQARVSVRLLPLGFRHFHARSVRGRTLTFDLRQRLDTVERTPSHVDAWPPIPGLANPPDPAPEPPAPPRRRPWRVTIDRSRIDDVRRVWIDGYRIEGAGRAEGRLALEFRRLLTLGRVSFHLREGLVSVGSTTVAHDLDLDAELGIPPFVPREVTARTFWGGASGQVELHGQVSSLAFANAYFGRAPWLRIDGTASLALDVALEQGEIQPGSWINADADPISVRILAHEFLGSGVLRGTVLAGERPRGKLAVDLGEFDVRRAGAEAPYVRGTGFHFEAISETTRLGAGFPDLDLVLEMPPSQVTRFEVYGAYLPAGSGIKLLSGTGKVRGRLEVSTSTQTGSGELALEGEGIRALYESLPMVGDVRLEIALAPAADGAAEREAPAFSIPRGRLELGRVTVGPAGSTQRDWWARLDFADGRMAVKPLELSSTFDARLRDTRPILAVFAERNLFVKLFKRALAVEDVRTRGRILLDERSLVLEDLVATGEGMEVLADLTFTGEAKRGILFAELGPLAVGVELKPDGRDWKLVGARRWYLERSAARGRPASRSTAR